MKKKAIFRFVLILIGGILSYFIVSERWIGGNGERWKFIVDSDGRGYYAYLPAIFIYQDLNFDFVLREEATVYGKGMADYLHLANGQRGDKYFIGEALLIAPFFLCAWLVSWLSGFSINGYNKIFFGSVSIAALFYLLASLLLIRKLLQLYRIREAWIQVILIMLVFGTNVFHYTVYEPSMSHIYSFAAVSGFLFFLKKYQRIRKPQLLYLSAVSLGIITLIRPVNGIIILAVPFLMGTYNEFKIFIVDLIRSKKRLVISVLIFSAIVSIQLFILFLTYGDFFYWPYRGEGFNFQTPFFIDELFSYRKGLFIYTPLIFISILFIISYFRKSIFSAVSFILFFLTLNYILSSWSSWFYGGSFSLRAFLEFYPLLIIPMAVGVNEIQKKQLIVMVAVLLLAVLSLSIIQTYQYEHNIIHFSNMDKEKYWKVFLHTDRKYKFVSFPITADTIETKEEIILKKSIFNDFEGSTDWGAGNTLTTEKYFSGSHSAKMRIPNSFSPAFIMSGKDVIENNISFVKIQLRTLSPGGNDEGLLVVSFEWENNRIYIYNPYPLNTGNGKSDTWMPVKYGAQLPVMNEKDVMKIYVWNDSKNSVYIDDVKIDLFSEK